MLQPKFILQHTLLPRCSCGKSPTTRSRSPCVLKAPSGMQGAPWPINGSEWSAVRSLLNLCLSQHHVWPQAFLWIISVNVPKCSCSRELLGNLVQRKRKVLGSPMEALSWFQQVREATSTCLLAKEMKHPPSSCSQLLGVSGT